MKLFFYILLSLVVSSCNTPEPRQHQHRFLSFGTVIDITLNDTDQDSARRAFKTLEDDFNFWHQAWNPWQAGPLSRVNSLLPTQAAFSMPIHLIPLIEQSQQLYRLSDGLFNPAIGKLINLWRFHEHEQPDKQPPAAEQIQALVKSNPNMLDLALDTIRLKSNNPDVQLNFGAYAKGYALERSMQTLKKLGIKNAIINAGGDLKVIGKRSASASTTPWKIGIRHPRNEQAVLASINAMPGDSIFTSGDYERFFIYNGKRYNHILDPRTGYPANLSQSVTVIHADAAIADAAATALFIAGPENWYALAKKMGIQYVLLVASDGSIHMNPAMAERIKLGSPADIIISAPL